MRACVHAACSKARHSCYYIAKVYVRACVHACECPSGFVWVITPSFMHVFQNYLIQFLFLKRNGVI